MIFSEKYKNLKVGEVKYNVLRSTKSDNCYMCGRLTPFIDTNTEAHFCSEECVDKFYTEYFRGNAFSAEEL